MFHGFPRSDTVELNAAARGPILQGSGLKCRPMINRAGARARLVPEHPIQALTHDLTGHPTSHPPQAPDWSDSTDPRPSASDRTAPPSPYPAQHPYSSAPVGQLVPCGAPVECHVFTATHPPPERYTISAIEPPHSLASDQPALTTQRDPDPLRAKPRLHMRQVPDAESQHSLLFSRALPIPRSVAQWSHATGPRTTHLKGPLKPIGQFPAAGGPQTDFRQASDNMCVSRERSATNRFSRLFSSSSWRSRRSSLTPRGQPSGSRHRRCARPYRVAGRHRQWRAVSRFAGGHTQSDLPRVLTASSLRSFHKGPSKSTVYSSFTLSSLSGETAARRQ